MYVITGASGNTGSSVARVLLSENMPVRVVGRNADRLRDLTAAGAEAFVCDMTDADALTRAFDDALGVYVMLPPNISSDNFREYQDRITEAVTTALGRAQVKHAVTLSSIGADKREGTGPIEGLHYMETRLNLVDGLNVLHLRAGYFMENTLAQVGIIRSMGKAAGPLRADLRLPMITTSDIGKAAADALMMLDFAEHQEQELLGERDISMAEATMVIGMAIGRPDLRYEMLPDGQMRGALRAMGFSANMAYMITEMSDALNSGHVKALERRSSTNTTQTSYEQFVETVFVPAYEREMAHA